MLSLFRKILRPSLRNQLEEGVREALRRYADRRTAPDLRVYVSTDLVPPGMSPNLFARDEADHLRRFAAAWAQDNGIARAGLRVELVMLDTKREFAFVKPLGLDAPRRDAPISPPQNAGGGDRPIVPDAAPRAPQPGGYAGGRYTATAGGSATLEVVSSESVREPLRVEGEMVVGRRPEPGVFALGDRYMSGRHARFRAAQGRLTVTDLDSKNRTFVNETPIPAHQELTLSVGDTVRMGNTVLRLTRID
ncbi:MAG TPA: FHA domain-containing protein [Longimicrobiaceae bacterium]|jgi:hypothetical protein|nr:FHA domain-containing protein [Longimicrobiaceae bacterium]